MTFADDEQNTTTMQDDRAQNLFKIMSEYGVDVSLEDVQELFEYVGNSELSDDELLNITGGASNNGMQHIPSVQCKSCGSQNVWTVPELNGVACKSCGLLTGDHSLRIRDRLM